MKILRFVLFLPIFFIASNAIVLFSADPYAMGAITPCSMSVFVSKGAHGPFLFEISIPQEMSQDVKSTKLRFDARSFHYCEVTTGFLPDLKTAPA